MMLEINDALKIAYNLKSLISKSNFINNFKSYAIFEHDVRNIFLYH